MDMSWFFERMNECVDMLRVPMEEIRDRMDLMLKFQLVELPGALGPTMLAIDQIGGISSGDLRQQPCTWLRMKGDMDNPVAVMLPYEETKKRLGLVG